MLAQATPRPATASSAMSRFLSPSTRLGSTELNKLYAVFARLEQQYGTAGCNVVNKLKEYQLDECEPYFLKTLRGALEKVLKNLKSKRAHPSYLTLSIMEQMPYRRVRFPGAQYLQGSAMAQTLKRGTELPRRKKALWLLFVDEWVDQAMNSSGESMDRNGRHVWCAMDRLKVAVALDHLVAALENAADDDPRRDRFIAGGRRLQAPREQQHSQLQPLNKWPVAAAAAARFLNEIADRVYSGPAGQAMDPRRHLPAYDDAHLPEYSRHSLADGELAAGAGDLAETTGSCGAASRSRLAMDDTVRLQDDTGLGNDVTHVFREALVAAAKDALSAAEGDGRAGSEDSVEIVHVGRKRGAASPAPDAPAHKKLANGKGERLTVLKLDLSFVPPEEVETALRKVVNKHGKALLKLFEQEEAAAGVASVPMCDIAFQHARDNAKSPHRLYIRRAHTGAALVELNPLDSTCAVAQTWISWISPPPLTKSGKPFKKARNAARAPKREPLAVVPSGAGGLVDALAILSEINGQGVTVTPIFSLQLVDGARDRSDSAEEKAPEIRIRLQLDVSIDPFEFYDASYHRSRRILIDYLLPSTDPLHADSDAPAEASVDYFYACLHRAPRTKNGLPLSPDASPRDKPAVSVDADMTPIESEEDHQTRLHREAKGKQRAVEPEDESGQAENSDAPPVVVEEEDEMLYPKGLTVGLMPFQARSVRWMLAREGKRVKPRKQGGVGSESGENGDKDEEMMEVDGQGEDEDDLYAVPRKEGNGKGKGKTRAEDADDEDDEHLDRSPPVLDDLDMETIRRMKRGPLWQQVDIRYLDPLTGDSAGTKRLWFNRTLLAFSIIDPVDTVGPSGAATPVVKAESDGEDAIGGGEEPEHASRKVVGGIEGHGLLAEEVGLGKTVEALSLILTHRDDKRRKLPAYYNHVTDSEVQPCGATLIIAPTAIVGQWETEIARLAPTLRVLRYEGVKSLHKKHDKKYIAKHFDIILTTFDVLRKEVAFARAPTQRGLRNKREVRYRRSLLVELDFLRVLMDEAQMVGDAYGPTSETASLISRRFSWAVTSTPLRDKIADIKPLLTFLRVEPIASGRANIQRLLEETASFKRLWNEIGERTLKSQVQHELFLPQQIRYIVPIELTAVERYYYDQRYNEALKILKLDEEGFPIQPNNEPDWTWEPDKSEMLRALTTLRQLCTHPQIGSSNKEALGRVLKTVDEVYAAMREKAVSEIQSSQRAMLQARVKRAQYQMWDKEDTEERFERALALFKSATDEVEPIILDVSNEIHTVWQSRKRDPTRDLSTDPADKGVAGALELGYRSENVDENHMMTETERSLSTRVSALRNRLRDLLFVKHSSLFFSGHACFNMKRSEEETLFYQTAEHLRQTILQPYENAVERAQATLKRQMEIRENEHELSIDDFEIQFDTQGHGLRAITTFEKTALTSDLMNGYAELLFSYREQMIQMLLKAVSIAGDDATGEEYEERAALQERLNVYLEAYTVLVGEWTYGVDGTRSALSDQYKAEMSAYLYKQEVLPAPPGSPPPGGIEPDAPIEDLQEAVEDVLRAIAGPSGRATPRDDEEREEDDEAVVDDEEDGETKKKRKKGAKKKEKSRFQAKRGANLKANSYRDFLAPSLESGHAPADVLRFELLVERLESKGEDNEFAEIVPIRQLIKSLKDAEEEAGSKKEIALLEKERTRLQGYLSSLGKVADRLRAELSDFTKAFNSRLTYFANLQQISDEVADPDMDSKHWRGLLIEIETLRQEELEHKASIELKQSRRRYLDNLNSPADREEAETTCPICSDNFTQGVLTNCGHLTCAACFRKWHSVSKNCALCKQQLGPGSYTTVSYRKKASPPPLPEPGASPQKYIDSHGIEHAFEEQAPLLSEMDEVLREQIAAVETTTPLSSKSDFIVKHVKHIRRRDPDAKIVIFSNWQEALSLLMEAFTRNGVQYIRLEGATGKGKKEGVVKRFQEDPDIAAFLLHTKSQAAGLNLTVARYVFLVEPLLHPSLELQAVARVHRITQTKDTFVYKYAVSDTVDRRVEELRASQNTSLFLASNSGGGMNAAKESRLVQQTERASAAARKVAKTDELIDDEDQIAQILLAPSAFQNLQRSLLPARLRTHDAAPSGHSTNNGGGGVDGSGAEAREAGGGGGAIHAPGKEMEPAALAGIAAAGRAAHQQEEEEGFRAYQAEAEAEGFGQGAEGGAPMEVENAGPQAAAAPSSSSG
ncbi:hypothetical protein JCM10908_000775 [Rhodotorula pacifica]|uniref:E3 ubiquitin-protein ligase IRC20 n=1 Tax=Rhodotorula pacifica TaxID=1495444 RepID=UPI0031797D97